MAVVGNTCSEIGDILLIETQFSVLADYVQITSFVDSIIGTSGTRFFTKQFRASQDNLVFTDWMELNNTNISTIQGNVINNIVYFQFQYTRSGTDNTGLLEFVSITINGTIVPCTCSSSILNRTFMRGLGCGNFITAQLCSNLLKKLYKRGIIPEYIDRGIDIDDEDYISFWSAISCYFAMFVTYMSKYDTLFMQRDMLIEYLKQKDILVCDNETTLEDLQYISEHYFEEIRKRGTKQIYQKKGDLNNDGSVVDIDGELLRITCTDACDEFILNLCDTDKIGWCVGKCSPLYKGNFHDLNKGYEKDIMYVNSFDNYRRFYPEFQSIFADPILNSNTFVFDDAATMTIGDKTGFGVELMPTSDLDKAIVVSPNIAYEIIIMVKRIGDEPIHSIDFGVDCFDCDANIYTTEKIDGTGDSNRFFEGLVIPKKDIWYTYRGIIYPYGTGDISFPDNLTNAGIGNNLRFGSENINQIIPYLCINKTTNGVVVETKSIVLAQLKVRMLGRNYSLGFIQTQNLLELYTTNKQTNKSEEELDYKIRRKLLPYNSNLILNVIGGEISGSNYIYNSVYAENYN